MGNNYRGSYKKEISDNKGVFDWNALIYWLVSLIISLIPLYIEFIKYLNTNGKVDINFWTSYFVNGDILWVFSTFLLFALVDSFNKKRKKEKIWVKNLFVFGVLVFLATEVTWIVFNFLNIDAGAVWTLYIGIPLIMTTVVVSTPLKIEFIKED